MGKDTRPSLAVRQSRRGPGIFSHVIDVRIERMVERVHMLYRTASEGRVLERGYERGGSGEHST